MSTIAADHKATMRSLYASAAEGWDRWFEWYARNFAPPMAWCCEATGLKSGDMVLDIACGSGLPALAAARRVQPDGRVIATDIAAEMLTVAERRAGEAGLQNIEFREMDAEQLAFPDATFDAVTCAYALMFCPEPAQAVAEVRRVLKPGGRFAFVVWDDPTRSPFITVAGLSVARLFPAQPPNPNAPGVFRFAEPGALESVLRAGGFTDWSIESLPMTLECESVAEYWRMFTDMAAGIKAKIASLDDDGAARLRGFVEAAANPYLSGSRLRLVATSLCATGRK